MIDDTLKENNEPQPELQTEDASEASPDALRRLKLLAAELLKTRNEAVEFRAACGVERQWREDEMLFAGVDITNPGKTRMIDYATGEAPVQTDSGNTKRSKVVVNIVRPKCEIAEGRFGDILLPVDDRNWGLKLTPDPETEDLLKDQRPAMQDGQPITKPGGAKATMRDVGKNKLDAAQEKMDKMAQEIDDQLTECNYNAECRKVICDAVRKGTGVLKGPDVVKRIKTKWSKIEDQTGVAYDLKRIEDKRPASKRIDTWDLFPDPEAEEIDKATYIWERGSILPRELRKLIGIQGYDEDSIKIVLEEAPKRLNIAEEKSRYKAQLTTASMGQVYETWEYNGDVPSDILRDAGFECPEEATTMVSVLYANERPVKITINPLGALGDLPYDFFTWSSVPGSIWGVGVARQLLWQQRVLIATWRAMMDNAGDSAGVNVVLLEGIEPMNDLYEVTGKKLWRGTDDIDDVRKAFAQFQVENNQVELENIINLALRFIDQETSLPTLFQGEAKTAPETLGATNIMVDANNVGLRTKVKQWDDSITRPHLKRYYAWNMLYNEDDACKGDYFVDPRGTSVLYEKDQRAQNLLQAFNLKGDPDIGPVVDWQKAVKQLFQSLHLDIMKDKSEIAANEQQPPPSDPKLEVAKLRSDSDLQKEQIKHDATMQETQLKSQEADKELQFKAQEAEAERQFKREIKQMEMDIKVMELSQTQNISIDKIKADLARDAQKINLQRELAAKSGKAEQVLTPPSEPAGRAREGHAFEE